MRTFQTRPRGPTLPPSILGFMESGAGTHSENGSKATRSDLAELAVAARSFQEMQERLHFAAPFTMARQAHAYTEHLISGSTAAPPDSFQERFVREISRLKNDWDGQGGLAPSDDAVQAFEMLLRVLPSHVREPELEVDGSSGSITMRWVAPDGSEVFSLTVAHHQRVTGVRSSLINGSTGWVHSASESNKIARAVARVPYLFEYAALPFSLP